VSQCVGDTLGPGGVFRGLRHLAVLDDVLRDMAECAPAPPCCSTRTDVDIDVAGSAVVNPDGGLCHSVQGTAAMLAEWCGVPESELVYWAAGINHQAWFLTLRQNEEDLLSRLRHWCSSEPASQRAGADRVVRALWVLRHRVQWARL